MNEPQAEPGRLSAEAAFELLGNPSRLGILKTLWEADGALSFTELRRATDIADSGQFNYHLNRLVGHYVAEGDGGYGLTRPGEFVVGAILADAMDQRPQFGSFPVEGTCRHCGGGLEAAFEELGVIRCVDCETVVMADAFPPAGELDRSPAEIARAFDHWLRHRAVLAWRGVCPRCAGRVDRRYEVPDDGTGIRLDYACTHCGHEGHGPLVGELLEHPAVVTAYYERGIDVRAMPWWEARHLLADFEEEVLERDPLRVRVTVAFDDSELVLTVDEHGEVDDVSGG